MCSRSSCAERDCPDLPSRQIDIVNRNNSGHSSARCQRFDMPLPFRTTSGDPPSRKWCLLPHDIPLGRRAAPFLRPSPTRQRTHPSPHPESEHNVRRLQTGSPLSTASRARQLGPHLTPLVALQASEEASEVKGWDNFNSASNSPNHDIGPFFHYNTSALWLSNVLCIHIPALPASFPQWPC